MNVSNESISEPKAAGRNNVVVEILLYRVSGLCLRFLSISFRLEQPVKISVADIYALFAPCVDCKGVPARICPVALAAGKPFAATRTTDLRILVDVRRLGELYGK